MNGYGIDLSGLSLSSAYDISSDGRTIVGRGVNTDGFSEAWIAVIPEPSVAVLLGIGLMSFAASRRCLYYRRGRRARGCCLTETVSGR